MRSPVIAHIDMDAFFAAVEQRDNPALKGQPVVIGADPKGGLGRGVVSTCSYEARAFGIHSALPISIAYKKCPHAVFLRGSSAKYSRVSKEIFRILHDFTPDVQPISIDEAFMDLSGCWHFDGTPYKLCQRIKKTILEKTHLTASIGLAPVKFVAKIASDMDKPDGLFMVKPGEVEAFLEPLPIEKLWGVGQKSKVSLNAMGILTVGDLAHYDRVKLIEQLGQHGEHLYRLANGIDPRGVEADDDIKSVSHEHTYEVDEKNIEKVHETLLRLSEKVSRRLRKYGEKGRTVSVKIRTTGFHTFTRAQTLPKRVDVIDDIYVPAKELLDEFFQPGMQIRLIGVRVSNFDDPYVADSLFENAEDQKRENVQSAMDQIKDKFGEKSIHRGA